MMLPLPAMIFTYKGYLVKAYNPILKALPLNGGLHALLLSLSTLFLWFSQV